MQLQFSKPVNPLKVTASTLQVVTNASGAQELASGTVGVSADGETATFTLTGGLRRSHRSRV